VFDALDELAAVEDVFKRVIAFVEMAALNFACASV
jgi:hypothetical protein